MLNEFFLERELLVKIERIEKLCRLCKLDVSNKIREKSVALDAKIPDELNAKMCETVVEEENKTFECRFCGKSFNDGRKLGGHISRAHPNQKVLEEPGENNKEERKNKKVGSEYSIGDETVKIVKRKMIKKETVKERQNRFYMKEENRKSEEDNFEMLYDEF